MSLFDRSASLFIQSAVPGQVVVIEDFRIIFNVTKTEDNKDNNTAKIEIYNLNENTRNLIKLDDDPKTDQLVTLNAGYKDDEGEQILFVGTMTSINHKLQRPNVISVIEASDGKGSLSKTKVALSESSNSSAKSILNNMLPKFNIPNNLQTIPFVDKIYSSGFASTGLGRTVLDSVTDFLGLSWSVQNNEIKFIPFDGDDGTELLLISTTTGMKGSPERLTGETRKAKKKTKKIKPGWKVESLLFPRVNPNSRIAISSKEIPDNTVFIVNTVTHSGDTHGADWGSVIEVHEK